MSRRVGPEEPEGPEPPLYAEPKRSKIVGTWRGRIIMANHPDDRAEILKWPGLVPYVPKPDDEEKP